MSSAQHIEFVLDSLVPISVDQSGRELSGDVVIRNTVEEAVPADAVDLRSGSQREGIVKPPFA